MLVDQLYKRRLIVFSMDLHPPFQYLEIFGGTLKWVANYQTAGFATSSKQSL